MRSTPTNKGMGHLLVCLWECSVHTVLFVV